MRDRVGGREEEASAGIMGRSAASLLLWPSHFMSNLSNVFNGLTGSRLSDGGDKGRGSGKGCFGGGRDERGALGEGIDGWS